MRWAFILLLVAATATAQQKSATITIIDSSAPVGTYTGTGNLIDDQFESASINTTIWNPSIVCATANCCQQVTVSDGTAQRGSRYARATLTATSGGGNYRCELGMRAGAFAAAVDTTYYYGYSIRLPTSVPFDPETGETTNQFHHGDNTAGHHAIRLFSDHIEWEAHAGAGGPEAILLQPMQKNRWYRLCVRARWSTNSSGHFRVWIDAANEGAAHVFDFSGQTLHSAFVTVGRFKVMTYKTRWRQTNPPSNMLAMSPRIWHFDDVRIGTTFASGCG